MRATTCRGRWSPGAVEFRHRPPRRRPRRPRPREAVAPFLSGPLPERSGPVSLDLLDRFAQHPVRVFLRERLGVSLFDRTRDFEDAIPPRSTGSPPGRSESACSAPDWVVRTGRPAAPPRWRGAGCRRGNSPSPRSWTWSTTSKRWCRRARRAKVARRRQRSRWTSSSPACPAWPVSCPASAATCCTWSRIAGCSPRCAWRPGCSSSRRRRPSPSGPSGRHHRPRRGEVVARRQHRRDRTIRTGPGQPKAERRGPAAAPARAVRARDDPAPAAVLQDVGSLRGGPGGGRRRRRRGRPPAVGVVARPRAGGQGPGPPARPLGGLLSYNDMVSCSGPLGDDAGAGAPAFDPSERTRFGYYARLFRDGLLVHERVVYAVIGAHPVPSRSTSAARSPTGMTLLEASAGTGKTFTIAAFDDPLRGRDGQADRSTARDHIHPDGDGRAP